MKSILAVGIMGAVVLANDTYQTNYEVSRAFKNVKYVF